MKLIKYTLLFMAFGLVSCTSDEPVNESDASCIDEENPSKTATEFILSEDESRAAAETAGFDEKFFQAMSELNAEESTVLVSPLSVRILLAMTANAAHETVRNEICAAMGTDDIAALNTLCGKYLNALPNADAQATIKIANGMWYDELYSLTDGFGKIMGDDFRTYTRCLAIHTDAAREEINQWVNDATEGKIQSILGENVDELIPSVMANAIYFKGQWANPFDKKKTERKTFTGVNITQSVNMMYNDGMQHYAETETFQAVKMELGKEGILEATFVLPKAGIDIQEFVAGTSIAKIETARFYDDAIDLYLPKFEIPATVPWELNAALENLGIESINRMLKVSAFNEDVEASFKFFQSATVEVSEEGAEGAAVTWNFMVGSSGVPVVVTKPKMEVNRPFMFYISHPSTGAILFAARVGQI